MFTKRVGLVTKKILIICCCLNLGFLLLAEIAVSESIIKVTSRMGGKALHKEFSTGDNYALIIGINNYKHHPHLKTAVKDAKAVTRLLEDKYFFRKNNIIFLKNTEATSANIQKAFRDLVAQRLRKGDNVLIYYAGHGWYDEIIEAGYWVTSEATKDPTTYIANNTIYKYIKAFDKIGVQHVLLVSDSCFAGSFIQEYRTIETEIDDRYFQEKYKRPSRNIIASGGVERVADFGKDGHSIFAYYFLKTLRDNTSPFLSVKQLGVAVEKLVCRNSNQTPISRFIHGAGDEGGQFFFINSKSHKSGYMTVRVSADIIALPNESRASFNDIIKAEEVQRQAKDKWKNWQQTREKEYKKVKEIDKSENLTPKQKVIAWQRFLTAVSQDNPYSLQDDEMRSYSKSHILHWENVKPIKKTKIQKKVTIDLSHPNFGNYHALLIGNNNYEFMAGFNCFKKGAEEVARLLLDDYGFNVNVVINATRRDIMTALNNLRTSLGDQDNLLIYYAGHGWLDKEADEGYWLPVDAEPDNKINWVSNSYIISTLKAMHAKHVLIVANSCYSGKLTRGYRIRIKTRDYFTRIAKKRARSVLTHGTCMPECDSGIKGDIPVFTSAILNVLKENEGVLDATELYSKIRRPVQLQTGQTPEYSDIRKAGHAGGDFIFVRKYIR